MVVTVGPSVVRPSAAGMDSASTALRSCVFASPIPPRVCNPAPRSRRPYHQCPQAEPDTSSWRVRIHAKLALLARELAYLLESIAGGVRDDRFGFLALLLDVFVSSSTGCATERSIINCTERVDRRLARRYALTLQVA